MDRVMKGVIAGVLGGIVMNIWSFISVYILKFSNLLYLDWLSVMLYGHKPENSLEFFFSLFMQIVWSTLLAVIFAYLILLVTSKNHLIKGVSYGIIMFLFHHAVAIMFKIPHLQNISSTTTVSESIGAAMWGLVLSHTLYWLDTAKSKN